MHIVKVFDSLCAPCVIGEASVYVNNKNIEIPVTVNGLVLERTGGFIIVESDFGFRLRWDSKEAVFVDVCQQNLIYFIDSTLIAFTD